MKKFALILGLFLFLGGTARAEIYYGIDINDVYNTGDWNNKAEIKEIIDDYTLLLKFQKELDECANNIYTFECLNDISEKVLYRFYNYNFQDNMNSYNNYVKATFSAYGVLYCLNKYNVPSGTMCNQENFGASFETIRMYIQKLITQINHKIREYGFINAYSKVKKED